MASGKPPLLPATTSRLIASAITLGKTLEQVRALMKCTPKAFEDYRDGRAEASWRTLDDLVMFVVGEQEKLILKNRELLAQIRAQRKDGA